MCGPPGFHYGEPCDLVLEDGSPACDCAGSAEYTSGSIMTQGKQAGSWGVGGGWGGGGGGGGGEGA